MVTETFLEVPIKHVRRQPPGERRLKCDFYSLCQNNGVGAVQPAGGRRLVRFNEERKLDDVTSELEAIANAKLEKKSKDEEEEIKSASSSTQHSSP